MTGLVQGRALGSCTLGRTGVMLLFWCRTSLGSGVSLKFCLCCLQPPQEFLQATVLGAAPPVLCLAMGSLLEVALKGIVHCTWRSSRARPAASCAAAVSKEVVADEPRAATGVTSSTTSVLLCSCLQMVWFSQRRSLSLSAQGWYSHADAMTFLFRVKQTAKQQGDELVKLGKCSFHVYPLSDISPAAWLSY